MKTAILNEFIKKCIPLNDRGVENISLLDIYCNEIGRFLDGKLDRNKFLSGKKKTILHYYLSRLSYKRSWKTIGSDNQVTQAQVLIHVNEKSHLREFVPIYLKLQERYSVAFVTVNLNVLKEINKLGYSYFNLYSVKSSAKPISSNTHKIRYAERRHLREKLINCVKNYGIVNDIQQFLKIKRNSFNQQYSWYYYLFTTNDIKFALVANDLTSQGRLFARIAASFKVNTYSIQHGNIYDDWIGSLHIVDHFFTYGKLSCDLLKGMQLGPTSVHISGSPFLNNALKNRSELQRQHEIIRRKYSLPDRYNLVAFSGYGHLTSKNHYLQCLTSLKKLAEDNTEKNFVVKLHPKEAIESYQFMSGNKNLAIIEELEGDSQRSFLSWLLNADSLITGSSTTAIEAMLFSIPVLSLDYANEYQRVDFKIRNAVINVASPEELYEKFKGIDVYHKQVGDNAMQFVNDYYGKLDLNATSILLNKIHELE